MSSLSSAVKNFVFQAAVPKVRESFVTRFKLYFCSTKCDVKETPITLVRKQQNKTTAATARTNILETLSYNSSKVLGG